MGLIDYIAGRRLGREARRIEREAMEDAFLRDALDGYDAVEDDHVVRIERMRRRVTSAPKRLRSGFYRAAAAAVLLCAALGGYWLVRRSGGVWTEGRFAVNGSAPVPGALLPEGDSLRLAMGPECDPEADGSGKKTGAAVEKKERITTERFVERQEAETAADLCEEVAAESPAVASVAGREGHGKSAGVEKAAGASVAAGPVAAEAAERREVRQERVESKRYAASGAVARSAEKTMSVREEPAAGNDPAEDAAVREDRTGADSDFGARNAAVVRGAETASATDRRPPSCGQDDTMRIAALSGVKNDRKTVSKRRQAAALAAAASVREAEADGAAAEILSSGDGASRPRGGKAAFVRYVAENRRYPTDAESPRGQVVLRFEVGADGRPRLIEVVRGLSPAADAEAVRLLREGPLWTAGNSPVELAVRF